MGYRSYRKAIGEVLYITDLKTHKVYKTSLDGAILNEWGWPQQTGKYDKEDDYRPSWTLHFPDGGFFVLDGYGRDYITRFDASRRAGEDYRRRRGGHLALGAARRHGRSCRRGCPEPVDRHERPAVSVAAFGGGRKATTDRSAWRQSSANPSTQPELLCRTPRRQLAPKTETAVALFLFSTRISASSPTSAEHGRFMTTPANSSPCGIKRTSSCTRTIWSSTMRKACTLPSSRRTTLIRSNWNGFD